MQGTQPMMGSTATGKDQQAMPDGLEEVLSWFGISREDDPVETRCVCAALEVCLQDLEPGTLYSRTRSVLGPLVPETRAHIPKVISVHHSGQLRDKSPWVNLAVVIANYGFIRSGETDDPALKTIWRLLVELLCGNPPMRAATPVIRIVDSLRTRLNELAKNPTGVSAIPFSDPVSLVRNFEKEPGPFPASIVGAWRTLKPSLLGLLLYPEPDWRSSKGESAEDDVPVQIGGDDATGEAMAGFYIPSDDELFGSTLTTAGRQVVMETHLSTLTSLSRLTLGSSTHLSDEELSSEVAYLIKRVTSCHEAHDVLQAQAIAGRLMILATASTADYIGRLRRCAHWGDADDARYGATYPGRLSSDAQWLFRPQIDPNERDGKARSGTLDPVWVPIPKTLSDLILRVGSKPGQGNLVFPDLRRAASLKDSSRRSYPATALRRALIERLAHSEPLGLSAAQYVSG